MYFIAYIPVRDDVVATNKLFRFKRVFKVCGEPHIVPIGRLDIANSVIASCVPFVGQIAIPLIGEDIEELHETMSMLYEIGSEVPVYEYARLEAQARLGHAFSTVEREMAEDDLVIELDADDELTFLYDELSEFIPGGKVPVCTSISTMFYELPEYAQKEITNDQGEVQAADVVDAYIMIHADGVRSAAKLVGAALRLDDMASQLLETVDEKLSNTAAKINNFLLRKLVK